jgi:hypothetical protein
MLDSRYDDLKSGRAKPVDGEEYFDSLRCRGDDLLKAFAVMSGEHGDADFTAICREGPICPTFRV